MVQDSASAPMSLAAVYAHEMALLPVVMSMTARGMRVNNELRQQRIAALQTEADRLQREAEPLVANLRSKLKRPDLMWERRVCRACRNGKLKRQSCPACAGAGSAEHFHFNCGSAPQLKDVLYNGLKLPRRTRAGKDTTDEEALQSLCALDPSGLVRLMLRHAKLDTMREIYERLAPASDGCVRTVFNPAGTYTGRFSAAGAFYIPASTNLQNLPAAESTRDALYRVRECVTPRVGCVFLYADLSQAEARVVACLSEDTELLKRWEDPSWDAHRWTASKIFQRDEGTVSAAERYLGKRSRHALNYGLGHVKFWRYVNADADLTGVAITQAEAKKICAGYHALHPNLDAIWWNRVQRRLEAEQPLENCFGRRCNFYPRIDPYTGQLDHETLRAAVAWEPQSTVSHLSKLALLELHQEGYALLHEGHDSVLLEVAADKVEETAARMKRAMEREIVVNGYTLKIPCDVHVCRTHWAESERVA